MYILHYTWSPVPRDLPSCKVQIQPWSNELIFGSTDRCVVMSHLFIRVASANIRKSQWHPQLWTLRSTFLQRLAPTWIKHTYLQLCSLFRSVWLGLELNSAVKWNSGARVEDPWSKCSVVCSDNKHLNSLCYCVLNNSVSCFPVLVLCHLGLKIAVLSLNIRGFLMDSTLFIDTQLGSGDDAVWLPCDLRKTQR